MTLRSTVADTASNAIKHGDVCLIGDLVGVAVADQRDQLVTLQMEGVFSLAKNTGISFNLGEKVFWDHTNRRCVKQPAATGTNNYYQIGLAWGHDRPGGGTPSAVDATTGKNSLVSGGVVAGSTTTTMLVMLVQGTPLQKGVFNYTKLTGAGRTFAVGQPVYLITSGDTKGNVTDEAAGNTFIGITAEAANTSATDVDVVYLAG